MSGMRAGWKTHGRPGLCQILLFAFLLLAVIHPAVASPHRYFGIRAVDEETGRGIPLVELTTVHQVRFVTDSAGWAAVDEPGLAGEEVYFAVRSDGYEYPADGFGNRGVRLRVEPGGREIISLRRINAAERLCRLTGEGIYRDSVLLGLETPLKRPLLNGGVIGQDSIHTAVYGGRLYWFWGDTSRLSYPLGNFHMSGATTPLPEPGDPPPDDGVDFQYFVDESGFSRPMAPVPGEGPTWLSGIVALPDQEGRERLVAGYVKIKGMLDAYERGTVLFDDKSETFVKNGEFPLHTTLFPFGHAVFTGEDGYVYFGSPSPRVRVKAKTEDFLDHGKYEGYTFIRSGTAWEDRQFELNESGGPVYAWKRNTPVIDPAQEAELLREGRIAPEKALLHLIDPDTGEWIRLHHGSVAWNAFRNRWILIASGHGREFCLSDVWYAESDLPQGPWQNPRRILTHGDTTFYNPKHHPFFDRKNGRVIYFEGTYSIFFSPRRKGTPRYDYNQILYRLDLDDERLGLPK